MLQERSLKNVPSIESSTETSVEVKLHTAKPENESENPEQDENDTTMQEEFFDSVEDMEEMPVPKKSYNLDFLEGQDIDPFKTKSSVMNSPDKKDTITTKVTETVLEAVDKMDSSQLRQEEVCTTNKESVKVEATDVTVVNPSDKNETLVKVQAETIATDLEKTPQKQIEQKADDSAPEDTKDDEPPAAKGYNLDFLSKLDDPDYDPFKTTSTVANSPDHKEKTKLKSEESKSVLQDNVNNEVMSSVPKTDDVQQSPDHASPPRPSHVLQLEDTLTTNETETSDCKYKLPQSLLLYGNSWTSI